MDESQRQDLKKYLTMLSYEDLFIVANKTKAMCEGDEKLMKTFEQLFMEEAEVRIKMAAEKLQYGWPKSY